MPAVTELPACHQSAPACQVKAKAETEEQTPSKLFLKKICQCDQQSQGEIFAVASALLDTERAIHWQTQPAFLALEAQAAHLTALPISQMHNQRTAPAILAQGRSASILCRFLI